MVKELLIYNSRSLDQSPVSTQLCSLPRLRYRMHGSDPSRRILRVALVIGIYEHMDYRYLEKAAVSLRHRGSASLRGLT
jgi:hypothetical protein